MPRNFGTTTNGRSEPGLAFNQRQRGEIERLKPSEALPSQRLAGEIRHDPREVADATALIENSRLFAANFAIAQQLHRSSLGAVFCMMHAGTGGGNGALAA